MPALSYLLWTGGILATSQYSWSGWAGISSIIKHVRAWQRIDPSWWISWIFVRKKIGRPRRDSCCCEMRTFYNEVYSIETLLRITCQIISELKHPRFCYSKFVSIWPAPEVVDGIFEVCPSATKFCPLVNKPVALGFLLWWQIFDINKQFCPLVRLGPYSRLKSR